MRQFLEGNWLSIISILIGVIVAYIFYRLQKKDSASASAERKKRATAELLDVVESYIINKQRITDQVIVNLINASERDHQVALRPECTPVSLLQDVALRLQRSRHLDIPQKSEYSEKIDDLIKVIREDRRLAPIPDMGLEIAFATETLKGLIPDDRQAEAEHALIAISNIAKKQRAASVEIEKTKERFLALTTALLGAMAALSTTLIGGKFFSNLTSAPVSSAVNKILPLVGALFAVVVMLAAFTTLLRIRRRTAQGERLVRKTDS